MTNFSRIVRSDQSSSKHLISNYRSIPELVRTQHSIAQALNPEVEECVSKVDEHVDGEVRRICVCNDDTIEAQSINEAISEWIKTDGLQPNEICVLVRQTPQRYASKLIENLSKSGIKARIETELQDILAEPIAKLLVSMLKFLVLKKSPVDWNNIIEFMAIVHEFDDTSTIDIENELGIFITEKRDVIATSSDWTNESVKGLLEVLIDFLGLDNIQNTYRQYEQGACLKDLVNSIAGHLADRLSTMIWEETIYDFEGHNSIPIITLHKSKGLEFHTVVFIGLEDQALWNYDNNPDEETCGFFVAFLRAKKRMIMTASLSRPDR